MWVIENGPELARPELVGHKFARQAVLARDGFCVPPLLCIPAAVFDRAAAPWLAQAVPARDTGAGDLAATARELRQRILAAGIPDPLSDALAGRFDCIAGDCGLVAVRACVVPDASGEHGEDSAQDPYAGLSDSYLYVSRDGVAAKVAACWASAFSAEAVVYRARHGLDPFGARVAVGVQRMAMGSRSFVAFSRDPRNGAPRCVVAAAYGIGEGVVQEKADIDHFFIDAASGQIEAHIGRKSRAVGWDPARPGDGPVAIAVDGDLASEPVLADGELKEIAALANRVEELSGAPQDIEGTITPDGQIHLLQARPIAAARPVPSGGETAGRPAQPITWDNNNVTESFPGVSCALTYSVALRLYEAGFTDLYRRMGVPAGTLRRNAPLLRHMIGYLDGRIYYRIGSWYQLHGQIRCFRPLWTTWERSLGLQSAGAGPGRKPPGMLSTAAHLAEIVLRLAAHPRRVRRFLRWWDEYHAGLAGVPTMSPREAVEAYHALWAQVGRRWGVTLVNGVFLFTATWAANGLTRRWLPEAGRGLTNGMLCGGPENRSAAAVRSALALAETAGRYPAVTDLLESELSAREIWERLGADASAGGFMSALRAHLRAYGDRGMQDLKLETRTPREAPWTVLDTVRAFRRQGQTAGSTRAAEREARAQAERELRRRCRNPAKRVLLAGLFTALRTLVRVREDTRFCRSELFGDYRALLMRLGEALAEAGRLDQPADVLDLTADEVTGAFDGTLAGADLRGLAAVRAAERARWAAGDPLPPRLQTDPDVPMAAALAAAVPRAGTGPAAAEQPQAPGGSATPQCLTGLASSSGTVRGRAKVVLDPSVPASQCQDRVIVARETDPGWLFLMMSARALVVERGTMLSHTAITGRLLGIPTVVSVAGATTLIEDGALVEVDGTAGTVRILGGAT